MKTKLTLSIEESIVEAAKQLAKEIGTSLSNVIENQLKMVLTKRTKNRNDVVISPQVRKLRGVAKLDPEKSYKQLRAEMLEEKYGK
tara:strand:- start:754 stop:1011 length:258 start_codon:yes stop_codon:yes gene_type:complete